MQRSSMVIAGLAFGLSISLAACAQNGSAIKSGKQIDQSEEKFQEKLKKTRKDAAETAKPHGPSEKTGESVSGIIEETLDETKQANNSLE